VLGELPNIWGFLFNIHFENDSRIYFLIVLLTDSASAMDVSYSGALQILR